MTHTPTAAAANKVQCQECHKRWATRSTLPQCSRCGSVDVEPVGEAA